MRLDIIFQKCLKTFDFRTAIWVSSRPVVSERPMANRPSQRRLKRKLLNVPFLSPDN